MSALTQVAVLGATGYAGEELARILQRHPRVAPPMLFSRSAEGSRSEGNGASAIRPFDWQAAEKAELLFLATPHDVSWEMAPQARARGMKVVDLSGAWRNKQAAHRAVYGLDESGQNAALLDEAVYGVSELAGEKLRGAKLVANPGCYATSVILGLAPLLAAGIIEVESGIIADCKSGVSGAGKQPSEKTHFVEVAENLSAYSVFGHRHTGEIAEQLQLPEGALVFTPHLLPIARGILSTIYVRLAAGVSAETVAEAYRAAYGQSRFVRLFPTPQLPQIRDSVRTNRCDIGFAVGPRGRMIVVSCLDNLMKGAAGQAVQNMNLMHGWAEWEGLE